MLHAQITLFRPCCCLHLVHLPSLSVSIAPCPNVSVGAASQVPQLQASFKGSLKPLRAVPVARRAVVTRATCSAEGPKVGTALAAAALAAALSLGRRRGC